MSTFSPVTLVLTLCMTINIYTAGYLSVTSSGITRFFVSDSTPANDSLVYLGLFRAQTIYSLSDICGLLCGKLNLNFYP